MKFSSINAELLSERFDTALKIEIIKGNNMHVYTSTPLKSKEVIQFSKDELVKIVYYFGEFTYEFTAAFETVLEVEGKRGYKFVINSVEINNNYRREKRKIVEYKAILIHSKGMNQATILDLSKSGMKVESSEPVIGKKIEIHYNDEFGVTREAKGKIVWTKELDGKFHYGIKLN